MKIVDAGERSIMNPAKKRILPKLKDFSWAVGVECSVLPHIRVDQFEWTQHDRLWKEDFKMIREDFGRINVRYCLPWNLVEPSRGKFDWRLADERINYITRKLGLKLTLDIMHFGTPLWLPQAAGDVEFPEALERLAGAIATRYGDRIDSFCPFNEPLITALFSGDFGFWPPYSRRWRGYMPVLSRIAQATLRATRAIRRAAPDAQIVLCDSCEHHHTHEADLEPDVELRNLRRFLMLDLVTGRVDATHPLYLWLQDYGFSAPDLEWIRANRAAPDVIGLDYYSHTETQLESVTGAVRQRKPECPLGLYGCALEYWNRYGIPLAVTETSCDGSPLDRELWLKQTLGDCRRLREEGIPLIGYTWWPCLDNIDWDGALLHHIGKIHNVGMYNLRRQRDGSLKRVRSPLVKQYKAAIAGHLKTVGKLETVAAPKPKVDEIPDRAIPASNDTARNLAIGAPRKSAALATSVKSKPLAQLARVEKSADECGIIVFSHLRWGFVWQRPQQFVSRFARKHRMLFIEEPLFDLNEKDGRLFMHQVMPNVVVACPHFPKSDANNKEKVLAGIERFAHEAVKLMNDEGHFDSPMLYYYNPMDVGWSLGKFNERAVIYDCMDELSQFKDAPKELVALESRLIEAADVVFTGGYQMYLNKSKRNSNCHFFGCGVDVSHFAQARSADTAIPPDIDFMSRPILGWFGVIDERVDYTLLDKLAESHPEWSIAMIGPVVKIDPSLLPNRPNLFWLGSRDYRVLPNYCSAFNLCMMPFAINHATQYINPTKALEYMATSRPIVSTAISDVIKNFGSALSVAHSHDEFIAACEKSLKNPDQAMIEKGLELAEQNSWDSIVSKMLNIMYDAIAKGTTAGQTTAAAPRIATDEGILEITWSYPSVAGS
jgi:beta-glucosidase/6-phospho-beta-glucosidase/beta-galactosidase/glycosyltransferase involved in cell wall biosynthesis